jgi:peptidyl-prolyl cis-trans isomerase SurA
MPAIDIPVPGTSQSERTTAKPSTRDATPKPVDPAAAGEMPLETSPEVPVDPQPAKGSLTPQPGASADTQSETGQAGSPSASTSRPASPTAIVTAARSSVPRSSSEVRPAMFNPTALSDEELARNWKQAGRAAARVGDEVITLHDLVMSVKDQLSRHPAGRDLTPQELNLVAKTVLAGLIERALVAQEAKRALKNPKQLDSLYAAADGFWRERELPPLLRRYMADNENQLKQRFKETNRSLDAVRMNYRQDFLAQVFMEQKLSGQTKVELPEMLRYYNEHLHDKEFDRPAEITWRELVVEKSHYPNEAAARRKAEDLLARLNKGENFAALARAHSEGPSSVRAQGGLMQTSPGSYAVESVNEALEHLPLNQNSAILEGPTSLHIVRVENRRTAGPASFEEIQDQIRQKVQVEKMRTAREQFIKKLKRDTLITTIFDGTESDPNAPDKE